MCMIHAPINRKKLTYQKKEKKEKSNKIFNIALLKPDPTFVDERKKKN